MFYSRKSVISLSLADSGKLATLYQFLITTLYTCTCYLIKMINNSYLEDTHENTLCFFPSTLSFYLAHTQTAEHLL